MKNQFSATHPIGIIKLTLLGLLFLYPSHLMAQVEYTAEDSGWVSLFNGEDFEGLYMISDGKLIDPEQQSNFSISEGTITTNGPGPYFATKGVYENFQTRGQYKFGNSNAGRNAGLLYHVPAPDYQDDYEFGFTTPIDRDWGPWPTSVEFQMYNGNGENAPGGKGPHAGAFLGIASVWAKSTVNRPYDCAYDPDGEDFDVILGGLYCDRRVGPAIGGALNDYDNWVTFQLDSFGDSVTHFINDRLVLRAWNLEFEDKSVDGGRQPMTKGHLAYQGEGAPVSYRNLYVRMLDAEGAPIIPGCTNPDAENFVPFATEDDESCAEVSVNPVSEFQKDLQVTVSNNVLKVVYNAQNTPANAQLSLVDVSGKTHKQVNLNSLKGFYTWDVSNTSPGLMFVKITSNNSVLGVKKVLLQ